MDRNEILVVGVTLGLLAIVPLLNFKNAEASGRDTRRKTDLRQIYDALQAYNAQNGTYPLSSKDGKILGCTCESVKPAACDWHKETGGPMEFCDINNVVYLKQMFGDPIGNPEYCYYSDGKKFVIYGKLEIESDFEAFPDLMTRKCNNLNYNYGESSPNATPLDII